MAKINLLTEEVANLIAAGEVVDRPASVLKELLENAVDAGATAVTAELSGGGVSLLRVSDDGCGIASDDLPIALRRHATSKIRSAEDLDAILTLGFRGEALAAIAGVSRLEIVTRTEEAEVGTLLSSEYGTITDVSEVGCRRGTTVVVRDLFGNVPARRKFLKKDVTEAAAATAYAEKLALSHPEVAFTLIVDGNTRFETPGDGDVLGVLYAIEGREFTKKLLPVKGELGGMTLSGYIGRSDHVAGTRNRQNFFINGRYVRTRTVQAALEQAYTSYIAPGKFPVATLFLTVSPGSVDVNVHPAKLEVRFSDERPIFEIVYHAVRGALEEAAYRPELAVAPTRPAVNKEQGRVTDPVSRPAPRFTAPTVAEQYIAPIPQKQELSPKESLRILSDYRAKSDRTAQVAATPRLVYDAPASSTPAPAPTPAPTPEQTPAPAAGPEATVASLPPYRIVGEAFATYILVEQGETLLLIDKHAAHERILFEELLAEQKKNGAAAMQGLLLPLAPHLTATERAAAEEYRADLTAAGFSYTLTDSGAELDALPARVSPDAAEALFTEMVASLAEGAGDPRITAEKRREKTLWQVACKAAVKGGRHYDEAHVTWLVEQVLANPDITVCPHGRPIAVTMTKSYLDREFNRIQH